MTAGRKPNNEPATAEDRAILLVQVLASNAGDEGLLALCAAWNVAPVRDFTGHGTIRALARHALEHGREGTPNE